MRDGRGTPRPVFFRRAFFRRAMTDRGRGSHERSIMRSKPTPLALLCLAGLTGCPDRTVSSLDLVQEGEIAKEIPISADIDLLFVIDNSSSTLDKQAVFAANFPRFVQALDAFEKGRPNLHIGVVSTTVDLGVSGIGGCAHPASSDDGLPHNTPSGACPVP